MNEIPKNVINFIAKASSPIGEYYSRIFYDSIMSDCVERGIESPIEQILYTSIKTLLILNGQEEIGIVGHGGKHFLVGIDIYPQEKIGEYFVDFKVSNFWITRSGSHRSQNENTVIVECDGHKFHDRDEAQRRYEKKRDRFLLKNGFKVFHYTGKEIKDRPFSVAQEVLSEISTDNFEDHVITAHRFCERA